MSLEISTSLAKFVLEICKQWWILLLSLIHLSICFCLQPLTLSCSSQKHYNTSDQKCSAEYIMKGPQLIAKMANPLSSKESAHCSFSRHFGTRSFSRSSFIFSFLGKSSLDINNSKALKWLPVVLVKVLLWCRNLTGYASSVGVISSCLLDTLLIHCHLQGCLRSWKNYCVSRQRGVILITWFWILTF